MHIASGDLWAGAEAQVFHLALELARRPGIEILVIVLNDGELAHRLLSAGVRVAVLDEVEHGVLSLLLSVTRIAWQFKPDLVHTHGSKQAFLGSLAASLVRGARSIRTHHGGVETDVDEASSIRRRIMSFIDKTFVERLQEAAVAVSEALSHDLSTIGHRGPIIVIPNGVPVAQIRCDASMHAQSEQSDRIHICFAGRLVPVKRVDIFLRAVHAVVQAYPGKYRFYVIGDGPLRAHLERLASELALGHDCIFTGFVTNSPPLLQSMAAIVLTSDHEGTPMVALEALALGVPVIAHSVGGLVPLLERINGCRLIQSQDPMLYADAITSIAPPGTKVEATREVLLPGRYTIQHSADEHAKLYGVIAGAGC
jgi:glycosyltransferase involved in cell wall biosynthesis